MNLGVHLSYGADGEVVHFALQGRGRLNLIGSETLRAGAAQIRACHQDARLRCAVLTGSAPDNFIGGADLKELGALTPDTAEAFIRSIHEFCAALRALPVPVVARVAGHCLGGGLDRRRLRLARCRHRQPVRHAGGPHRRAVRDRSGAVANADRLGANA